MWKKTKMELANRLCYSPLARLILMSFWTRMVLLVLLLGIVGLALCLPKIWTTTPAGITPIIRVSVIDMVQAWSLRRRAERQMATGQVDEAIHSWGAAVANNTADPRSLRGYLRAMLKSDRAAIGDRRLTQYAAWLLHLTKNDPADLELVAQLYDQRGFHLALMEVLRPIESKLSPTLEAAYLKALFNARQYPTFAARLQKPETDSLPDPELELYRAAYAAGWGPAPQASEARQKLARAAASGPHQVIANRLMIEVCNRQGDVAGCQLALNGLIAARSDRLTDHSTLWRLLLKLGRKSEANQLVQAYIKEPTTLVETLELAKVCVLVGQRKRAMDLLTGSFDTYGFSVPACIRYAAILIEDRQWSEVRSFALRLRAYPGLPNSFLALASIIEAEADLGEGRRENAEITLRRLPTYDYDDPELGLGIANSLIRANMLDVAMPLLSRLEGKLENNPDFWRTSFDAARAQTNLVMMARAAQRFYEVDPGEPVAANNYAGILLLQRTQLDLALRLTTELFRQVPNSYAVRINHAAALVANGRAAEAREILLSTGVPQLSASDLAQSLLVQFEVSLALGFTEEAWLAADRINREYLYAPQRQWLDDAIRTLPPRSIAAPTLP